MSNDIKFIRELMDKYDESFYLYEESVIERQVDTLIDAFPDFEFLYSMKTNPFEPIVDFVVSKGFGIDAASAEEVKMAKKAGLSYDKVLYSTPGKRSKDIEEAIEDSIIIADSYNELILINEIAGKKGLKVNVGLRINMDFHMDGKEPVASKFGVDEDSLVKNLDLFESLTNLKLTGIHVHLQSQILDYDKLRRYYESIFNLGKFCQEELKWELEFINFGGGLGIVYSQAHETPLDIEKLSQENKKLVNRFKEELNVRLLIETGRFVIGEAGKYVSKIVDIKESRGVKYLIIEKGLNGFLRPSIAALLSSYLADAKELRGSEPLFTRKDAFEFLIPEGNHDKLEKVDLVGSLCTATDIVAKDADLPQAKLGDIVIVTNAGSYSYSLSPILFSSHHIPYQIYRKKDSTYIIK